MTYEQITFEKRGRAGLITLNRPERLNAWTPRMMIEMRQAIDECVADPQIAAAVVTGAGRAFCAGADVGDVFQKQAEQREQGQQSTAARDAGSADWVTYLRTLPKPTIAAVNGTAVGIGVTQVLPMDIRIAAESARFGMFFVKMGLSPELASSALLPQMVGTARAIEWCLTARLVPAQEAKEAGLVSDVVPGEKLLDRAFELVDMIAKNPAPALAATRKLIVDNVHNDDIRAVQASEGATLNALYQTWEHKEAIAAFMGKRDPDFSKRP
jgi:2-(1,2-epoxy-1,2-dihydrophenyl)acetyl-CoA isomerase